MSDAPLDPALVKLFAEASPGAEPEDLAAERADYEELAARHGGPPADIALVADEPLSTDAGSLRVRRYVPEDPAPGTIVYFHGGGWTVGSVISHDVATRAIANTAGVEVVSVDYRLAPEHPFPAAVEDCEAAVRACSGPIAVAGDSAGANLATVIARRLRDAGTPAAAQALAYPVTAEPRPTGSYVSAKGPLGMEEMRELWRVYAGDADPSDPDLSPLRADLRGLPPALVALAAHDVLHDDGAEYAEALREAGVEVEVVEYPTMAHGFLRFGGVVAEAGELAGRMGEFLGRALRAPGRAR